MTILLPHENCHLSGDEQAGPLSGIHRVLWASRASNLLVMIPVPLLGLDTPYPKYFKGPRWLRFEYVLTLLNEKHLNHAEKPVPPPVFLMSDEQVRRRYKTSKYPTKNKQRVTSNPIQIRDKRYSLIKPILDALEESPLEFYQGDGYSREIQRVCKAREVQEKEIRSPLHAYLSLDIGKNALMGGGFRCGAKGTPRMPTAEGARLGRPNKLSITGNWSTKGFVCDQEAKSKLAVGWQMVVDGKYSVEQALVKTCRIFWSDGFEVRNGVPRPKLLPEEQRPTISQFKRWGPARDGAMAASEILIDPIERQKKNRPMTESSVSQLRGIGQLGSIDATRLDVTAVSVQSILDAVSQGWILKVSDCMSDLIHGFCAEFDAPSELTVAQALYHAASDKTEQFRRFGVSAPPAHIPPRMFNVLREDNGEARNIGTMTTLLGMGVLQEFIRTGRADFNSVSEAAHHSMHRLVDHLVSGTTQGRVRRRGEEKTAVSACWNWLDLQYILLTAIAYRNAEADASSLVQRLPFRTEMLREPDYRPTRLWIDQWCQRNNYDARAPLDPDLLRVRFLPVLRARIKQRGVFLLRPDSGAKAEHIRGLRYSSGRAIKLGWHCNKSWKGRKKFRDIDVHVDPNDLSRIWFADDAGVHELQNCHPDWVLPRDCRLADVLELQDHESLKNAAHKVNQDQALSDYQFDLGERDYDLKQKKKAAIDSMPKKPTKAELSADQRANKRREQDLLNEMIDPMLQAPRHSKANEQKTGCQTSNGSTLMTDPTRDQPSSSEQPSGEGRKLDSEPISVETPLDETRDPGALDSGNTLEASFASYLVSRNE